jgi:hypothetical protein
MRKFLSLLFVMGPEGAAGGGAAGSGSGNAGAGNAGAADPNARAGTGNEGGKPAGGEPPRKLKLKVDSQELELEEAEVIRRAEIGTHATKRLQQAAELERREHARLEKLKKPQGLFEMADEMGYTPDEFRAAMEQEYKRRFLDRDSLTPEQKRIQELEEREQKRLEAEQKQAEQTKGQQKEMLKKHHQKQFATTIKAALEQMKAIMPNAEPSERWVKLAAREVYNLRKAGLPADPASVATEVRRALSEEHRMIYKEAPLEFLREMLGEDVLKRMLTLSIEWHRAGAANPPAPKVTEPDPAAGGNAGKKPSRYIKMNDWQKSRQK